MSLTKQERYSIRRLVELVEDIASHVRAQEHDFGDEDVADSDRIIRELLDIRECFPLDIEDRQ